MTKTIQALGLLVAVGTLANSASALTVGPVYNLGTLVTSGDSITFGDKVFDDFGYASAAIPNAGLATVTPWIGDDGVYHLKFQGPWIARNGAVVDINLQYTVATVSGKPFISMIDQSYVLSAAGTTGFILIGETVRTGGFAGPVTAQSSLSFVPGNPPSTDLEDPSAEPLTGDDLIVNPSQAKLWVTKDIFFGANQRGLIGPSVVDQSFHQTPFLPDGGVTVMLLGVALSGLGLIRRRVA